MRCRRHQSRGCGWRSLHGRAEGEGWVRRCLFRAAHKRMLYSTSWDEDQTTITSWC